MRRMDERMIELKGRLKRLLSGLMVLAMVLGLIPLPTFAATTDTSSVPWKITVARFDVGANPENVTICVGQSVTYSYHHTGWDVHSKTNTKVNGNGAEITDIKHDGTGDATIKGTAINSTGVTFHVSGTLRSSDARIYIADHTYSYTYNNDATCVKDGTKSGSCTRCGAAAPTITDQNHLKETVSHTWNAWEASSDGSSHNRKCTVSGCTASETHTWNAWTNDAKNHTRTCSIADCSYAANNNQTAVHQWDAGWQNKTDSSKHERTCAVCGRTEEEDHNWDEGEVTTAPNCVTNTNGVRTFHCQDCDATKTEDEPWAHSWNAGTITKAPSCTEDGVKTTTCTIPGCNASTTETIPNLGGHIFGDYVTQNDAVAPTCTKPGKTASQIATCTRDGCNETDTKPGEDIAMTAHSFQNYVSNGDATCLADGTETGHCSVCGAGDTRTVANTKADHAYVSLESKAATCTADGYDKKQCSICGTKTTVTFEKLDHIVTNVAAKDATCEEDGNTAGWSCSRCGEMTYTTIPASGHNYPEAWEQIPAELDAEMAKSFHAKVCSHDKAYEHVLTEAHNLVVDNNRHEDATLKAPGQDVYVCSVCGYERVTVIPQLVAGEGKTYSFNVSENNTNPAHCEVKLCVDESATITFVGADGTYTRSDGNSTVIDCPSSVGNTFTVKGLKADPNVRTRTFTYTKTETSSGCGGDKTTTTTYTVIIDFYVSDHDYDSDPQKQDKTASCEEQGETYLKCTKCGLTKTDIKKALGHSTNEVLRAGVAASCKTAGYSFVDEVCTRCEKTIRSTRVDGTSVLPHTEKTETVVVSAPSCTVDGSHYVVVSCTVCGDELSRNEVTDPATGHLHTETLEAKEATCSASGLTAGTKCSDCGTVLTAQSVVHAKGHSFKNYVEQEDGVKATCTEDGKTASKIAECDNGCGETSTKAGETIPKLGHSIKDAEAVYTDVVSATCTAAGSHTENFYCTECGALAKTEKKVDNAKGHAWPENFTVTRPATCTVAGTQVKKCETCQQVLATEGIAIVPHTLAAAVRENEVDSTCAQEGSYDSVVYCSVCKQEQSRTTGNVIAKKAHTVVNDAAIDPTCITTGLTAGSHCSVCNEVLVAQTERAALGHIEVTVPAKAPTCTEDGLTAGITCSRCGDTVKAQETVNALGHTVVTDAAVSATCTAAGKTEGKHCSVCGEVITAQQTVNPLGHTEVIDAAVTATCTTAGKTEGKHCSVCGAVLVAQTEVPAKGHKFSDAFTVDITPTCTTVGSQSKHCLNDGCSEKSEVSELKALGHATTSVLTQATCTEDAYTTTSCTRCNKDLSTEIHENTKLGHQWGEWVKDDGQYHKHVCTRDGYTEREIHTVGDPVITKPAAINVAGEQVYYCSKCAHSVTEPIPALADPNAPKTVKGSVTSSIAGTNSVSVTVCEDQNADITFTTGTSGFWIFSGNIQYTVSKVLENGEEDNGYVTYNGNETVSIRKDGQSATLSFTGNTPSGESTKYLVSGKDGNDTYSATIVITVREHSYGDTEVKAATCLANGYTSTPCVYEECGHALVETLYATDHSYDTEYTVDKAATCTAAGKESQHCLNEGCTATQNEQDIAPLNHPDTTKLEAVAATCTQTGLTEGQYCNTCKQTIVPQQPTEKAAHSYKGVTTAPTCSAQGYTTYTCENCDESYVADYTNPIAHTWNNGVVTTEPTCMDTGVKTFTCIECSATKTESVEANGHSYTSVVTEPTCTEGGYTTHTCSACEDSYTDAYIPAAGHTEVSRNNGTAATCTEPGRESDTYCSVCNADLSTGAEIPANGHKYSDVVTAATCTEGGYTTHTCSVCAYRYTDAETEPLNHSWTAWAHVDGTETHSRYCLNDNKHVETGDHHFDDGVETTPASCAAEGVTTFTCDGCRYAKELPIVKLAHTPAEAAVEANVVPANCTTAGSRDMVLKCTVCGEALETTPEVIPALGHTPVNAPIWSWRKVNENWIATYVRDCANCTATTDPVEADSIVYSEKTELGVKYMVWTASAAIGEKTYTNEKLLKKDVVYSVTINQPDEQIVRDNLNYADLVRLDAPKQDGMVFIGWYEGSRLVSSNPKYSFHVIRDIVLTAKYTEDKPEEPVIQVPSGEVLIAAVGTGKIDVTFTWSVPTKFRVIEIGFMYGSSKNSTVINKDKVMSVGTQYVTGHTNFNGTYILHINTPSSSRYMNAVGYVIYEDDAGNRLTFSTDTVNVLIP